MDSTTKTVDYATETMLSIQKGLNIVMDYAENENNIKEKIEELLNQVDLEKNQSLNALSVKISELVLNGDISEDVKEDLYNIFSNLNTKFVAVRSSGVMEDGNQSAWAGQFESYLNVGMDGLSAKL